MEITVAGLGTGRRAVSVEEAARQLGIGRSLAYELVRVGKIRHFRAGIRILIPLAALEEFLAGQGQPEAEEFSANS